MIVRIQKLLDGTPHAVNIKHATELGLKEVRDGRLFRCFINNEVEKIQRIGSLTVHSSGVPGFNIAKDGNY
ncbi:hypothetical protein CW304_14420 [Bacillus sp. UFRGS-B20]|nr:hypothetical protein CW304_14420 [Bacillus sp. UFRGS-B20]